MSDLSFEIELARDRDERLTRTVVDLRACRWSTPSGWAEERDCGNTSLTTGEGEIFSLSPEALKQMMDRLCGGLYRLSLKTPADLIEPVVDHWLATLSEGKSAVVLKSEGSFVWGLLGVEQSDLDDHAVLIALRDSLADFGGDALEVSAQHVPTEIRQNRTRSNNVVTPTQFYRVYLGQKFSVDQQEFESFVDVRFSPFALGKFEVEIGLSDPVTNTSSLIRPNSKPLVGRNYRMGLDATELSRLFMLVVERLRQSQDEQQEILQNASDTDLSAESLKEICEQMPHYRDCTERFAGRVVDYCLENTPQTRLSLYCVLTMFAAEEAFPSRSKHEAFAGLLVGLHAVKIEPLSD